ncbi:hypothetical protein KR222_008762 [Zaprionus bogoriensis]|nr:hypothetical protein KR222_008762 [Zaprionus bogoriensis]
MTIAIIAFSFILFCCTFSLSTSRDRCSAEYCNFAGDCTVIGDKPSCQCYEETFHGEYCETVRDLCSTAENTCLNKSSCIPYVGQTICDCPQRSSGIDCRNPEGTCPTKLLCNFNVRVIYGTTQNIVISFEKLGNATLEMTVSTSFSMIANGQRPKLSEPIRASRHTTKFTETLGDLGIRRHIRLPYNDAYYYVYQANYYVLGANELRVAVRSFDCNDNSKSYLQTLSFIVHVVEPFFTNCLPKVVFQHGMDPMRPRQVDIERFTNIQAIVEKSCDASDTISFSTQWNILDILGEVSYFKSKIDQELLLKIPRYSLWYEGMQHLYPNIVLMVQLSYKERTSPLIVARCYIKVTAPNVIAKIAGGHYREVNGQSRLTLDGSQSREPTRRIRDNQFLVYTWTLSSGDGSNESILALESASKLL